MSEFGDVMQHGYIVPDVEAAALEWVAIAASYFCIMRAFGASLHFGQARDSPELSDRIITKSTARRSPDLQQHEPFLVVQGASRRPM